MGDRLGTPGAVGNLFFFSVRLFFFFFLCDLTFFFTVCVLTFRFLNPSSPPSSSSPSFFLIMLIFQLSSFSFFFFSVFHPNPLLTSVLFFCTFRLFFFLILVTFCRLSSCLSQCFNLFFKKNQFQFNLRTTADLTDTVLFWQTAPQLNFILWSYLLFR